MKQVRMITWALSILSLHACSKEDNTPPTPVQPARGVYVLSEGSFFGNNAKLGFYSLETSTFAGDYYLQQNPGMTAGLGDVATDVIIYGSKLYIIVNNSNVVRVLHAANGTHLANIAFTPAAKQPRFGVGVSGKVFVTAYDGTVNIIDTTSLSITGSIPVGLNPEGITISGDFLYVANSGGLSFPTYDSTVSVISLSSLTEIQKITVGKNPNSITADDAGNVYVSCLGDYGSIAPKMVKIQTSTRNVVFSADTAAGVIRYYNNRLYTTGGYLGSAFVRELNTNNFAAIRSNFVTDGTVITNPYGITIDEQNGDVYITDAKDFVATGELFCFNPAGVRKFSVATSPGINPVKVAFVR
jgi:YVTN family beta-propeller protein